MVLNWRRLMEDVFVSKDVNHLRLSTDQGNCGDGFRVKHIE